MHAADERRAADRLELDSAIQQVMEERTKFLRFHNSVSELVEQLLEQGIEDKNLARRTRELETRLAEQSQLLEASELERKRLREEIEVALKTKLSGATPSSARSTSAPRPKRQASSRARSHQWRPHAARLRAREREATGGGD